MWRRRYGIVIVHARNVPGPRSRAIVSWQVHAELLTKGCTVGEGHLFKLLKCYTKERMWTDAMQIYGQLTAEFDMLANSVRRRKRLTSSCRGPEGGGHTVVLSPSTHAQAVLHTMVACAGQCEEAAVLAAYEVDAHTQRATPRTRPLSPGNLPDHRLTKSNNNRAHPSVCDATM